MWIESPSLSLACACSLQAGAAAEQASAQPGALVQRGDDLASPIHFPQANSLHQPLVQVSMTFGRSIIYRMTCDAAVVRHRVWRHLSSCFVLKSMWLEHFQLCLLHQ